MAGCFVLHIMHALYTCVVPASGVTAPERRMVVPAQSQCKACELSFPGLLLGVVLLFVSTVSGQLSSSAPWPALGGGNDHRNFGTGSFDASCGATIKWAFSRPWTEFETAETRAAAIVADDDIVYMTGPSNSLYALNGGTGELLWTYNVGGYSVSSVSVGRNGLIYAARGLGGLVALLSNGQEVFRSLNSSTSLTSPVLGSDGSIYLVSDQTRMRINGATGAIRFSEFNTRFRTVDPLVKGGLVFWVDEVTLSYGRSIIHAANATNGATLWKANLYDQTPCDNGCGSMWDGLLYIGCTSVQRVYSINVTTGEFRWNRTVPSNLSATPFSIGQSCPAIHPQGIVYFASIVGTG